MLCIASSLRVPSLGKNKQRSSTKHPTLQEPTIGFRRAKWRDIALFFLARTFANRSLIHLAYWPLGLGYHRTTAPLSLSSPLAAILALSNFISSHDSPILLDALQVFYGSDARLVVDYHVACPPLENEIGW